MEGNIFAGYVNGAFYAIPDIPLPSARSDHLGSFGIDPRPAPYLNMNPNLVLPDQWKNNSPPNVFQCYVFKSRLQEYCQKAGLKIPVYETVKQGPSHEPIFRSTVTIDTATYDSLPGFFNRKAAEQSAAEVALIELAKTGHLQGKSQPVQETGLCKNLLQEYAQKMNFAAPVYECHRDEKQRRPPMHQCIVEIGGVKYIGASALTKKEAEIKAARTALLAIQSASLLPQDQSINSIYTVTPQKKRATHQGIPTQLTAASLKPKKRNFKKFQHNKRGPKKQNSSNDAASSEAKTDLEAETTPDVSNTTTFQSIETNTNTPMETQVSSVHDVQEKINTQETIHGGAVETTDKINTQETSHEGAVESTESTYRIVSNDTMLQSIETSTNTPMETNVSFVHDVQDKINAQETSHGGAVETTDKINGSPLTQETGHGGAVESTESAYCIVSNDAMLQSIETITNTPMETEVSFVHDVQEKINTLETNHGGAMETIDKINTQETSHGRAVETNVNAYRIVSNDVVFQSIETITNTPMGTEVSFVHDVQANIIGSALTQETSHGGAVESTESTYCIVSNDAMLQSIETCTNTPIETEVSFVHDMQDKINTQETSLGGAVETTDKINTQETSHGGDVETTASAYLAA